MQEEAEAAGEALAALDTTDIYQGLAMAREQANGFVSVLSKLGDGEGRLTNLHDAVMETARAMAGELGITDDAAIVKIGEELLEGLYDTYPGIADYVDTATGMLLDGWKEGIAEATNPWAELFEAAKLEDALKAAKRDMAALEDSSLWAELLAPGGKGLYQYAGDWARELIPDGTREEVQAQAEAFVEAFFTMFADIDTSIMDADGSIAAGMEGIVATMRQAAHDAQAEAAKLETAYQSLHADAIAREQAVRGLTDMMGYVRRGDAQNVRNTFEGLSTQAVDAITAAIPELIDKLMDGTYAAEDFEAAIARLREAGTRAGRDAWEEYFRGTADGLKAQSAQWREAMRGIIAEVSDAEDRADVFYAALMRLSDEGLDVSGLLDQYGALAAALLNGSANADELYASLARLGELEALQLDLEHADALGNAATSIDPAGESYDPLAALDAYALLEAEYQELTLLQRGSAEYLARAKQLTQEQTAAVYDQAAAYGVVTQLQAQSARAAAEGQRERKFSGIEENSYAGGVDFLTGAVRQAEENGRDVVQAWNDALAQLDEAGHLEAMASMFGDISNLAVACGGNVAQIVEELYALQETAQAVSLSDMAQALREEREGNFADADGYQEQIGSLMAAFGEGGTEGVRAAMDVWNSFDESLQQSIAQTYPS